MRIDENQMNEEVLRNLYWKEHLSLAKIARKFGMSSQNSIVHHMDKLGISRRPSCRKNQIRNEFSGNFTEKAYLMGLRTGDIHARKHSRLVNAETTSTKQAQIEMFKKAFGKYANVNVYEKDGGFTDKTNRVYCYLDQSFDFLIEKPQQIPDWILSNDKLFYSFLAGYSDSEGSWILTQHKKYNGKWKDIVFSLGTCDKTILENIHKKLRELGYNAHLYMVRKKGKYGDRNCNFNLYRVMIMRHSDVVRLAKQLLPLSRHEDKILAKKRITDFHEKNMEKKIMKRKNLGTTEMPCTKCGSLKVWRNGSSRYKQTIYLRYKCPTCKNEFQKVTV